MSTSLAARIRPQHTVDIFFVVALSALAMVGWSATFAGPGWWIAATAVALLGIAIAVAISDAGGGVQWVLLALIGVYLLIAGPLAVGRVELIGLDSFEVGMTRTGSSWLTLMKTHPPVDATGAVLIPPVLLSLFGPALAVSLSVRSRRMLAPLIPPSLAFVAVILMGQHSTTSVIGQGMAFAGVAVLWMRVRALRDEESGTGHDPARGRRIAASVGLILAASLAVVAVGAPTLSQATGPTSGISDEEIIPAIPDTEVDPPPGAERFLLRDRADPFDAERLRTPLDQFRDFTRQTPGTEDNVFEDRLLRVEGAPTGSRIRFAALDTYDGQRWKADNNTDPLRLDDRFLGVSSQIDNPAKGKRAEVTVTLSGKWDLPWVPTVGALQSFEFDRSSSADPTDLRYNPATSTAVMSGDPATQERYTFTTVIPDTSLKRSDDAAPYFDEDLFKQARFIDEPTTLFRFGAVTRIDALFKVAATLKKIGFYSDGISGFESQFAAGQSVKRLGEDFVLAQPTVGNDEQYAAAFALMVSRIRIPARVVVGAVVPKNGLIRGRDVQAWVEVRLADGTWHTVPTEQFMSTKRPTGAQVFGGPQLRDFPDPPDPEDLEQAEPQPEDPAREADERDEPPVVDRDWWWLLVVPLLVVSFAPLVLKTVRRRRRRRTGSGAARYAGAWAELIDRARDLGHDVPPGLTRPAQARVLARGDLLALEADRRTFASADPGEEAAAEFWDLVEGELTDLRHEATLWRRVWARITPRSLRRSV
ncbi:transglutaminase domain-containing protein [Nocardioides salsibiostraticola]